MTRPEISCGSPLDLQPFYEGLRQSILLLPKCAESGIWLAPGQGACGNRTISNVTWQPATGRGKIISFAIYRRAYKPQFDGLVPYAVGMVELEEGPRMLARITGIELEKIKIAMMVKAAFPQDAVETTLVFEAT